MVTALILFALFALGLSKLILKPESTYKRTLRTYPRNASHRLRESHPHFQNAIKPDDKDGQTHSESPRNWTMELLKSLVLRKSKKDGNTFWGCRDYPRCRLTINMRH